MKNLINGLVFLTLLNLNSYSQSIKTYKGNYENGTANYQYYENDNYDRIYQGTFSYKGIVAYTKGKLNFYVSGQYKNNKKEGKWTYTLTDPISKGSTEVVTGNYVLGKMEGEWISTTTTNNTKKVLKKITANFKENKLAGEIKLDYSVSEYKDFSAISIKGNLNDSGLFNGLWSTTYKKGNLQFEEIRKYKNGVLYLFLHRKLSDGAILEKFDSTEFVDRFFAAYDSNKKFAFINGQKYAYKENPDKYSCMLELPELLLNYWTKNSGDNFFSLAELNPIFIINYGYTPSPVFAEKIIVNWKYTSEGEKENLQDEQAKKATEEKFKNTIQKADSLMSLKLYSDAIPFFQKALTIREDVYAKGQLQKAQLILDQEKITKENEILLTEKTYKSIIAKADSSLNFKKYDVAIDLYNSALQIKDDQYAKDQIKFAKQINLEETRLQLVRELDRTLVTVESGGYKMGCLRSDLNCLKNEEPVHEVAVKTFQISKYELTNGQYKVYCKIVGKKEPEAVDNLPVTNISWNDAVDFAEWVGYRLPTEAEWEYAARGGISNKKYLYSGGNNLDEVAWYTENARNNPNAVGTKKPNILGIYDMTGNLWEWCSDWYGDYSGADELNPQGPSKGARKVKRGGSFSETNFELDLRITNRSSEPPEFSAYNIGVRLVKK